MAYYAPQAQTDADPFEGAEKTPSLSWRAQPIGTVFVCEVLESAKLLQSRDYETNEPAYWDKDETQPKMAAVINVLVREGPHSIGEKRSIWAQKPSDLYVAIAEAQKTAGARIAPGGILQLKFIGETPHTNVKNNPIKHYAARYKAPIGSTDPFTDTPQAPPVRPAPPAPSTAQKGW